VGPYGVKSNTSLKCYYSAHTYFINLLEVTYLTVSGGKNSVKVSILFQCKRVNHINSSCLQQQCRPDRSEMLMKCFLLANS